jgi:hypothetical protein
LNIDKENEMGVKLRRVKKMLADSHLADRIKHAKELGKQNGWGTWYEDYPVSLQMQGFLTAVKKHMPKLKFHPSIIDSFSNDTKHYIVTEFSVLMDGYPFDLGRVGYRDYSAGGGDDTYGVYSRKISNPKFGQDRDQHHMVMSSDVTKAVKNASKYILPYTHTELAKAYYDDIQSNVEKVFHDSQTKMHNVAREISSNRQSILAELLHLKTLGVTFKTDVFQKASEVIEEAVADATAEDRRKVTCVFVRFRNIGSDMYVDVQEAEDVRRNSRKLATSSQPTTYLMSELPEDIVGSISVLNILNDDQYVAKVGMKIDETTFWIERN